MNCKYIKENGEGCKAKPMNNGYCYLHNPEITEEDKQLARIKGGKNNAVMIGEVMDKKTIKTSEDVVTLMEDTINDVRQGRLDIRVANSIGYLAGITQKAIKDVEIEERLRRIEVLMRD